MSSALGGGCSVTVTSVSPAATGVIILAYATLPPGQQHLPASLQDTLASLQADPAPLLQALGATFIGLYGITGAKVVIALPPSLLSSPLPPRPVPPATPPLPPPLVSPLQPHQPLPAYAPPQGASLLNLARPPSAQQLANFPSAPPGPPPPIVLVPTSAAAGGQPVLLGYVTVAAGVAVAVMMQLLIAGPLQ